MTRELCTLPTRDPGRETSEPSVLSVPFGVFHYDLAVRQDTEEAPGDYGGYSFPLVRCLGSHTRFEGTPPYFSRIFRRSRCVYDKFYDNDDLLPHNKHQPCPRRVRLPYLKRLCDSIFH